MTDLPVTLVWFLVALSILIAVHEFGHFWVARRLGVKVLRFSIGFGRPLWTRVAGPDRTEYVISAIPLGGYVKMLDEREGEVAPEELHRAFNRQRVEKRFAIAAAGPLFNFAFAVAAYWLMFVVGMPGLKPIVGEVSPGSIAAAAGARSGEVLDAVGGQSTPTWDAAISTLLPYALRKEPVQVTLREGEFVHNVTFDFSRVSADPSSEALMREIGIRRQRMPIDPIVGEVQAGTPSDRAGLKPGDRILAIEGEPTRDWQDLFDKVRANPGKPLLFAIERSGVRSEVTVTPEAQTDGGKVPPYGRIGAGARRDDARLAALQSEWHHTPMDAVGAAFAKTYDDSVITLWSFKEMVLGRMSVKNISGPVTIAVYAKASASLGVAHFLYFLGLVSVSLAVLNLLPVPVLDGGHLLFYVAEFIKGGPVSERTEIIGQKVGIALILALMTIALYNDLARWVG